MDPQELPSAEQTPRNMGKGLPGMEEPAGSRCTGGTGNLCPGHHRAVNPFGLHPLLRPVASEILGWHIRTLPVLVWWMECVGRGLLPCRVVAGSDLGCEAAWAPWASGLQARASQPHPGRSNGLVGTILGQRDRGSASQQQFACPNQRQAAWRQSSTCVLGGLTVESQVHGVEEEATGWGTEWRCHGSRQAHTGNTS